MPCGSLLPLPREGGCSPGGIFLLLYSLGTALLWMEALREKARGAGGICVKRVVLRNKMMLELRAAGCCIPRVPVLLNKGMTKENDDF